MNINHENKIRQHKKRLKDVYKVEILYSQKYNACFDHHDRINILLKKDYEEYDFEHELAHLSFLTEEIRIKHLYPTEEYFIEKELFDFSKILTNVIYDIYVDTYLSLNFPVPDLYFIEKINILTTFLENKDKHLKFKEPLAEAITKSIQEYINVLKMIIEGNIRGTIYETENKIIDQREHINRYLRSSNVLNKFEWITYRTLYLRDQKKCKVLTNR